MPLSKFLIVQILQSFEWYDESMQLSLKNLGWPTLSRPEAMVLIYVNSGVNKPAEIARQLGLTRQAVHTTVRMLVRRRIVKLVQDPSDGRIKTVELTELGEAMRTDGRRIAKAIAKKLGQRIGAGNLEALERAYEMDWGPPITCPIENGGPSPKMREFLKASRKARAGA